MFGIKPPRRRKPVSRGATKDVLIRNEGKCEKRGMHFGTTTACIHHRDGNPSNNKPSNLRVLRPNFHARIHKPKPK